MEPQPRETGVIPQRNISPRRNLFIKGASFFAGAATLLSSVGCNNEAISNTLPTPVLPAATSTLKSENPTSNARTPKPPTATQESNPAPTATTKVEATPTPAKIELTFPYELAVSNEYQGPDVKVILGIQKEVYSRPAGNTCQTLDNKASSCPAIKNFELSDKWVKEKAPNQYPNGMGQEEMVQRLNDTVLMGHLANLHQNPIYKDLTLQGLKDLIHQNKAPEYSIRWPNGDSISVNTGKPVYIVAIDKPGTFDYTNGINFDYSQRNGSLIVGIWDTNAMHLSYNDSLEAFQASNDISGGLILPTIKPAQNGNANFINDLRAAAAPLQATLEPYQNPTGSAGIIVASGN